ncbi:ATP-binding protein [Poseidonocella sp. HB161398]|uniref:ATP-binding protein n=1 Tax=Poseidonocella sp. HB161398 TaxID=2320855 RepID=UPI0011095B03|nr:ATP-binding protein [Poseidonocella sp. HB161398]
MTDRKYELPEYGENAFIAALPEILSAAEAFRFLRNMPSYDPIERTLPRHLRVHCLMRLDRYLNPNERHISLERTIDVTIRQGYIGRNPNSKEYFKRIHNHYEKCRTGNMDFNDIPMESTARGISLIGLSGMGKTKSVQRILHRYPQVIQHRTPVALVQVPWIILECPYKGSLSQLCLSFFDQMSEILQTNLRKRYLSARPSIDQLANRMAAVANLYAVGLIVIDELQHLTEAPGTGRNEMLNFLVSLVNRCSTPIMLIGTPKALPIVGGALRQARRASGYGSTFWDRIGPGPTWDHFIENLWQWQWTNEINELTPEIKEVLHDESQGVIDIAIKLYQLAQMRAILNSEMLDSPEIISAETLRRTATEHLGLIKPMISALRSGSVEAESRYEDLRSLDMQVSAILQSALGTAIEVKGEGTFQASERISTEISKELSKRKESSDAARDFIENTLAKEPGYDPVKALETVLSMLKGELNGAGSLENDSENCQRASRLDISEHDIRDIRTRSADICLKTLEQLGYLRPPFQDELLEGSSLFIENER